MGGKMSFGQKFIRGRFFLLTIVALVAFFATGFLRSFWLDYQIRKETNQLEQAKNQWTERKIKLFDKLSEIESDAYAEKEARLRLGLAKPGEQVVIIKNDSQPAADSAPVKPESQPVAAVQPSNPALWWQYFFAKR